MVEKARIFGSDHGALQVRRNALIRHPLVPEARLRVLRLERLEAALHERGVCRREAPPVDDMAVEPELRDNESEDQSAQRVAEGMQAALDLVDGVGVRVSRVEEDQVRRHVRRALLHR